MLEKWELFTNKYVSAPWMVRGNQWVGYDDVISIQTKVSFKIINT